MKNKDPDTSTLGALPASLTSICHVLKIFSISPLGYLCLDNLERNLKNGEFQMISKNFDHFQQFCSNTFASIYRNSVRVLDLHAYSLKKMNPKRPYQSEVVTSKRQSKLKKLVASKVLSEHF